LEVPLDMPSPFLSSEEYDERAHQLYNEGQYEEALEVLREGLALYPHSVELHIGVGYARLAREEYAWGRRSFEEALVLDPEHEDALAGLGETLMKFGQQDAGVKTFRRILELGYRDDLDLMLQVGRALFRESLFDEAREFFEISVQQAPEMAEGVALLGYTQHRLGEEDSAVSMLRRALQIDDDHAEARIYLANILYDRGDYEAALYHLDRTTPEDHWDELGIWRLVELKKSIYRLQDDDPELRPWDERLAELSGEPDDVDEMLSEIEGRFNDQRSGDNQQGQLELFGALLSELADQRDPIEPRHRIMTREGREYVGSWDQIVREMRDANKQWAGRTVQEFMHNEARRGYSLTGIMIPTHNAESFIRGSADAGLLRIVR
jgi:tetratricopeptide (TPR) repeat protein